MRFGIWGRRHGAFAVCPFGRGCGRHGTGGEACGKGAQTRGQGVRSRLRQVRQGNVPPEGKQARVATIRLLYRR